MFNVQCSALLPLIDWRMYLLFWGFKGETLRQLLVNPEAERTLRDGKAYLEEAIRQDKIQVQVLYREESAIRRGNDIVLTADGQTLPMLRSQSATYRYRCLADYFDEQTPSRVGLFLVTASPSQEPTDETERLMTHALCARLAEAGAQWLEEKVKRLKGEKVKNGNRHESNASTFQLFNFSTLRVAFGYASCPDHSLKRIVFDRLEAEKRMNVTLTDHYSIQPSTSVCGLLIFHPEARYFPVGRIDRDQLRDYCRRRGITEDEGEQLLSKFIV